MFTPSSPRLLALLGACIMSSPAAAKKPSFPPILVLTAAEAQALPPLGTAASRSEVHSQACDALRNDWPALVAEAQGVLQAPSQEAYVALQAGVEKRLEARASGCPSWAGALAVQRNLVREGRGLYSPTHAADDASRGPLPASIGRTVDELEAEHASLTVHAWQEASLRVGRSWDAWRAQAALDDVPARKQRYVFNLGTDDSLVPAAGKAEVGNFAALVRVGTLPHIASRLAALQGQGPASEVDVAAYVAASAAEAKAQSAERVLFINAAAPQVPNFAAGVTQGAKEAGLRMHYLDLADWQDGKLVSPADAAQFARKVADDIEATPGKTLLVVNCNAGLDRSGTTNALVQLILSARHERRAGRDDAQLVRATMAQVPQVVAALKRGRPSSISSPGRYVFVYRAFAAALDAEAKAG